MQMRSYRLHLPLVKALGAALGSLLLVLAVHAYGLQLPGRPDSLAVLLCGAAGLAYSHFFEYFYHDVAMHRGLKGFRFIRESHVLHHRIFRAGNFRSRDPEHLRQVTTEWYAFPVLLAMHYAVFLAALPPAGAPAFFLGVTLHFAFYESCHWFTHVADNGFDQILSRIPVIRTIRAAQIRHHEIHHARPAVNLNFTPPYGGDRLCGSYASGKAVAQARRRS